jgi:type I restriction enzyme S subunit
MKTGSSGSKFQNGDTLFARITPCLENGKTGYVQSLGDGQVGRGSTEFIVFRGRLVGSAFTYLLARSETFRSNAIKSMSGASGRQRVRIECFDSFLVFVPPVTTAQAFEDLVRPQFTMLHLLASTTRQLQALRNTLLPRLVNGLIDASRIEVDEVADTVA